MSKTNFVHSVKVPHLYKVSSRIVKTILLEGGSLKELLYTKVRANLKAAYALITKTIERNVDLERIMKTCQILSENPQLDPWLAKVLVAELLFGKGALQSECKPVQTVLSYSDALQEALENSRQNADEQFPAESEKKPRYVRVNTLRKTCDEVIKALRYDEWELVPPPDSYEDFLKAVRHLTEFEFIRDFHLKNVLVFPPRTEFFKNEMYKDGTIILQDKASCLPPFLLNPDSKSTVLDMCAAPGMKTTMLAAMMRGKGKIFAMEIHNRRFKTLESIIEVSGCENVTAIEGDSLQLSTDNAPWCSEVDHILVDPSCSGTGMTDRARLFTHDKYQDVQLKKLTAFQRRLLTHALTKFPSARRVVYSTCSMQEEENEAVVSAVLEAFPVPSPWAVVPALPEWPSRGLDSYEFGAHCVTASPAKDLTTGFFIAVFERVEGVELPESLDWSSRKNGFVMESKKTKKEKRKAKKLAKNLKNSAEGVENIDNVSAVSLGESSSADAIEEAVIEPIEEVGEVFSKKNKKRKHESDAGSFENKADVSLDTEKSKRTSKRDKAEPSEVLEDVEEVGTVNKKKKIRNR